MDENKLNNEEIKLTFEEVRQQISQLIKKGKYDEAKIIGEKEEYAIRVNIQKLMIKLYITEGNTEKAIEVSQRECFRQDPQIQSLIMKMYTDNGEFDKALQIGQQEKFIFNFTIQDQIRRAKELKRYKQKIEERKKQEDSKDEQERLLIDEGAYEFLREIKTKIYYNKIDNELIEQINQSGLLSEYQKTLIMLAICEKKNMPERAKQIQAKANLEDENQKKEVRKIIERIKSKKKAIFNLGEYDRLLNWRFEHKLVEKYNKENESKNQLAKNENEDNQK